jgi:hypothetical protein
MTLAIPPSSGVRVADRLGGTGARAAPAGTAEVAPACHAPMQHWSSTVVEAGCSSEGSVDVDGAELTKQPELVELGPTVNAYARLEEIDGDPVNADPIVRRGDAEERPDRRERQIIRGGCCPASVAQIVMSRSVPLLSTSWIFRIWAGLGT